MRKIILRLTTGALLSVLLSACHVGSVLKGARNAYYVLTGRVPSSDAHPAQSEAERKLGEKSQLLHEMFQVVLLREPYGSEEFGVFVNTLSQGGSLEGIYNGFVNSEQYRSMEDTHAVADASTIKVFAKVISSLQQDLSRTQVAPTDLGIVAPFEPSKYEQVFARASIFHLKKILGQEGMKVVEAKLKRGEGREDLADWYSNWVVQMAANQVDFGLPLRNRADAGFHREWVKSLPADDVSDRVVWEVLNRLHRVLNVTESKAMRTDNSTQSPVQTKRKGGA